MRIPPTNVRKTRFPLSRICIFGYELGPLFFKKQRLKFFRFTKIPTCTATFTSTATFTYTTTATVTSIFLDSTFPCRIHSDSSCLSIAHLTGRIRANGVEPAPIKDLRMGLQGGIFDLGAFWSGGASRAPISCVLIPVFSCTLRDITRERRSVNFFPGHCPKFYYF